MAINPADPKLIASPMIARSQHAEELPDWQSELRQAYRDPQLLLTALGLPATDISLAVPRAGQFPFRVTRAFAARMRPGDRHDPLLLQVLPLAAEDQISPGFGDDPIGEFAHLDHGPLLQKYAGRALIVTTAACAIHCRYCFRRAFPYADAAGRIKRDRAIEQIANDSSIREVILSGGDPLMLEDGELEDLFNALSAIGHVERVRVHSRLPIVLPSRMTARLIELMSSYRYRVILVVHANHPREIDRQTADALMRCLRGGMTLLNQTVLLRGINDDADVLAELSQCLFEAGVLPYYIHALDRVSGAAHFEIAPHVALDLERQLRDRLSGYLVPRFVREVAGAAAKLPLHEAL
jgi:L-lysine 2,3-aminomutase